MRGLLVAVSKVELLDNEEMLVFAEKVIDALETEEAQLSRRPELRGIFADHVIFQDIESGRYYRRALSRANDGDVALGEAVEVRQVFAPVDEPVEKAADNLTREVPSSVQYHRVAPRKSFWAGVLS